MDTPDDDGLAGRYGPQLKAEAASLAQASGDAAGARATVTLDQQSTGRLTRQDALQRQAMAAAQEARRQGRQHAIRAALKRIENHTFGYCDDCGDLIGAARLDLDPTLMKCRDCASGG